MRKVLVDNSGEKRYLSQVGIFFSFFFRRFRHFCEQHFHLKENAQELSDGRPRPRIGPSSIFHALFHLGVLGLGSLLGLGQFIRFGRFMASCFAEIGSVCLMGGLEAIPKFGKELPSSQRFCEGFWSSLGGPASSGRALCGPGLPEGMS